MVIQSGDAHRAEHQRQVVNAPNNKQTTKKHKEALSNVHTWQNTSANEINLKFRAPQ